MALAVVGALILLLGAFLLGRRTSGDGRTVAAATSTTASAVSPTSSTAAVANTTTTKPGPATTSPAPAGKVVTGAGALLKAPGKTTPQSTQGPDADCHSLGDPGWTPDCGRVEMAGGTRVWLTESKAAGPPSAWRALVLHFTKGLWVTDLSYADDGSPPGITGVKVLTSDLTGDGRPELVFGFRVSGSGAILAYDVVVDAAGSSPKVGASRTLSHGSASVRAGTIVDYEAEYPNNEPNCCPAYILESTVSYSAGSFRVVEGRKQAPATATVGTDL